MLKDIHRPSNFLLKNNGCLTDSTFDLMLNLSVLHINQLASIVPGKVYGHFNLIHQIIDNFLLIIDIKDKNQDTLEIKVSNKVLINTLPKQYSNLCFALSIMDKGDLHILSEYFGSLYKI